MPNSSAQATSAANVQALVTQAISAVAQLKQGEKFTVRDLFLGYEWNRLSNGTRAQVGSGFYHQYANNTGISQVEILAKTPQNQQKYAKK